MKWLILLLVCICSTAISYGAPKDRLAIDRSVSRAREVVLASDLQLTREEIAFIRENNPTYSFYEMAGEHYVQYNFEWKMDDRRIIVFGQGDPYKLDRATVRRQQLGKQ
jgi:hypothetical protein